MHILNMHKNHEIAVCGDEACPVSTNNRGKVQNSGLYFYSCIIPKMYIIGIKFVFLRR